MSKIILPWWDELPRKQDPGLETLIIQSTLQLLDRSSVEAVTMREVARQANTTTPTVYARFTDRDALLWAVFKTIQDDAYQRVIWCKSVEQIAVVVLRYLIDFPGRLELMNRYWPRAVAEGSPQPVLEFARKTLQQQRPCSEAEAREISLALAALVIGAATLIRSIGPEPVCEELFQSALDIVTAICRR